MSNLSFDATVNSSDFLEKTEQMRSAIRATAFEMNQQGKKVSLSFQQMADSATLNAGVVEMVIRDMQKQIGTAIASLSKLDAENKARLSGLKNNLGKYSESGGDGGRNKSVSSEIDSRENLSADINNQYNELLLLNTELQNYRSKLEAIQNKTSALSSGFLSAREGMEDMRDEIRQTVSCYYGSTYFQHGMVSISDRHNVRHYPMLIPSSFCKCNILFL